MKVGVGAPTYHLDSCGKRTVGHGVGGVNGPYGGVLCVGLTRSGWDPRHRVPLAIHHMLPGTNPGHLGANDRKKVSSDDPSRHTAHLSVVAAVGFIFQLVIIGPGHGFVFSGMVLLSPIGPSTAIEVDR